VRIDPAGLGRPGGTQSPIGRGLELTVAGPISNIIEPAADLARATNPV
jgi:hypothetical protein